MADLFQAATDSSAVSVLESIFAHGVADGSAAASADSPAFLGYRSVIYRAWDTSCARPDVQPLLEQEEYFVAWVHGYVQRAEEIEDGPNASTEDGAGRRFGMSTLSEKRKH